ncbi:hypothetical protein ACFWXK_19220 [Streptomyces sp. NPDC059070]|uniref:hypothetical protein n=1 Tax=unclassified Streptomyces TaxID=2593676 RepID=UPI0034E213C8
MSEYLGAYINEASGGVHTGEGAQLNFFLAAAAERVRSRTGPDRRSIAEDARTRLYERFVAPPRMREARDLLDQGSMVLIAGPTGAGRRATALTLLHELPAGKGGFYELPDTEDDEGSTLEAVTVSAGDRLLLDLSVADETRYLSVQDRLHAFHAKLAEHGAHLAMVLPYHLAYLQRSDLLPYTVEIGRPSAGEVLARHLQRADIRPAAADLNSPGLTTYLTQAPLRDVADLADRIRRLRDDGTAGGFAGWRDAALERLADHSARVAADIAAHGAGRERALLLALAMFHGSTPATVFHAASTLLRTLAHPPDERPRLEHTDLNAELTALGAETGDDGCVRFRTQQYDHAVRVHFRTYFPDLSEQLSRWVGECVAWPQLDQEAHSPVIARFAEHCQASGRPQDLLRLAESWTRDSGEARLIPDAAQALVHGLAHERFGQVFRRQIYEWSTNRHLPQNLKQVLVLVCSEAMRRTHPHQALVRLHHLDRRASGQAAATARTALLGFTRTDHLMYRLLLQRIGRDLADGRWERDLTLFLELTSPVGSLGARDVRDGLTYGWAVVFRRVSVDDWRPYAERWFAGGTAAPDRDRLLNVLVTACGHAPAALGTLYRVAREWERSGRNASASRGGVGASLLQKINSAQGLDDLGSAV